MTLHDILRNKGNQRDDDWPEATLADVAQTLVRHNIGSLLVCQPADARGERLLGIITERDLVRAVAKNPATSLERMKVADVMVRDLITVSPSDSVEDTMGLMTERRIRHLPVVEDGQSGRNHLDRRRRQSPARLADDGKPLPEELHPRVMAAINRCESSRLACASRRPCALHICPKRERGNIDLRPSLALRVGIGVECPARVSRPSVRLAESQAKNLGVGDSPGCLAGLLRQGQIAAGPS